MSAKQKRNRFSLDIEYNIMKLLHNNVKPSDQRITFLPKFVTQTDCSENSFKLLNNFETNL